jgi:tetratricopeptide (TPR) repeat protein
MRYLAGFFALAVLLGPAATWGQRAREGIQAGSDEEFHMELVDQARGAERVRLLEEFIHKYPRHRAVPWCLEQIQSLFVDAREYKKAIETGERLLGHDPDDLWTAYRNVQSAHAGREPELVKRWTEASTEIAKRVMAKQAPGEETAERKALIALARQFVVDPEFAAFDGALKEADPKKRVRLFSEFTEKYPKSPYASRLPLLYFIAYRQIGEADKAIEAAERLIAERRAPEDVLLFAADYYFRRRAEPAKVIDLSAQIVQIMTAKARPQAVSEQQWDENKATYLGLAHYMTGSLHSERQSFAAADRELRKALGYMRGNPGVLAAILSMLGWANYRMERPVEAVKFYVQCAAIQSPYQAQAARNLEAIRAEYQVP